MAGHTGDAESVERNVPDELLPMRAREVVGDFAIHAGVTEHSGDVVCARLGPALEFAEHDGAMRHVDDDARLDAVKADEAESAHDLLRGKNLREFLLVAQP